MSDFTIGDLPQPQAGEGGAAPTTGVTTAFTIGDAPQAPSVFKDVMTQAAHGLPRGMASLAGLPSDVMKLIDRGWQHGTAHALRKLGYITPEQAQHLVEPMPGEEYKFDSEHLKSYLDNVLGRQPKAETAPGKATALATDIAPGVLAFGGMGAPSALREGLANISPAQLRAAEQILAESRAAGSPLTLPESIQWATKGATNLGEVQRAVEQSLKGGEVLKRFYAQRPEANQRMLGGMLDAKLGPQGLAPEETAARVQGAASQSLSKLRQDINAAAEPHYAASHGDLIAPGDFAPLATNPAFSLALKELRADPIIGPKIENLPDNSVGVIDAVKKRLHAMGETAGSDIKTELTAAERAARKVATEGSPEYEEALSAGAKGRQEVLGPAERSPLGQVAEAPTWDAQKAIIFSPNPAPGSHTAIGKAVSSIASKDPEAASNMVRMKIEQTFNEAAQDVAGKASQTGGAKFASTLIGNSQQAKNLEAAMKALPDGELRWNAFRKTMNIFEAQGQRLPPGGSPETARLLAETLGKGGNLAESAVTAATPSRWPGIVGEIYSRLKYGQNTEKLAKLFTEGSPEELRRIALQPSGTQHSTAVLGATLLPYFSQGVGARAAPESQASEVGGATGSGPGQQRLTPETANASGASAIR